MRGKTHPPPSPSPFIGKVKGDIFIVLSSGLVFTKESLWAINGP